MSYSQARTRAIKDGYFHRISDFLMDYTPGRPTVLFIPGGMGSQLRRSGAKYTGGDSLPHTDHPVVWYDPGLLFDRDLDHLTIRKDGHDAENHIVIPDGEVRYLFKPYNGTEAYFRERGCNYVVFGFDWRRPLAEGAGYLRHFLQDLRDRTLAEFGENPLPGLTLIGHSQGGLILQLWLLRMFRGNSSPAKVGQWFKTAICVGTPFYGTTNHMERYYRGEEAFSIIRDRATVVKIISSMPGPYVLMPMDEDTYKRNETRFARFGLHRYPVRDAGDPDGRAADPYDERSYGRYPPWVDRRYLDRAKAIRRTLARPLADAVVSRFFNLRSVADRETPVELHWDPVDGLNVKPDDDSPIHAKKGPGDGTVPAWAGALTQLPDHHIVDLKKVKGHVALMEHEETLEAIRHIMQHGAVTGPLAAPEGRMGIEPASREEMDRFLDDVTARKIGPDDARARDPKIWRRIMEEGCLC